MTFVYFAVEGDADVPVAERLIRHVGLFPHRAIVAKGVSRLDDRIPGLMRSATQTNWLILRDLDREQCAPRLVRRLFAGGVPQERVSAFRFGPWKAGCSPTWWDSPRFSP